MGIRWSLSAMVLLGCGAGREKVVLVQSPSAYSAPTDTAAPSNRPVSCVDGMLTDLPPDGLKVTGRPHDSNDPRASAVGAGVCGVFPSLYACRSEARKKTKPEGTLEITLAIDEKGIVTSAKRTAGSIAAGDLSQCVEKALASATFTPDAKGESKYDITIHEVDHIVKLIESGTDIAGRLHPTIIKPIIRAKFGDLRACYEAVLKKNPDAFGEARFEFIISEKGAVTGEKVAFSGAMNDPSVEGCMLDVVRSFEFPSPEEGKVLVIYPIVFQSGL